MRVGLNVLHLVPRETGGGELYVRRLVPALLEAGRDLELVVFAGDEGAPSLAKEPWAPDVELIHVPVRSRSRARRVLVEQAVLPRKAQKAQIDLLHNVQNTAPAMPRVPQVTTILDVIYKRHPETQTRILAAGVALLVPLAARRSRRILTLSEAAKDDIAHYLNVEPALIDVTPLGPGLADDLTPVAEAELRKRHELGDAPIVLTVSAKKPHKNLERLLDAIALVEADPHPLLVAPGFETVFEPELRRRAGDRVRFLGWVDDDELEGLYRAATCFVFPSLAEGFGLPVLEAMVRGTGRSHARESGRSKRSPGRRALYFEPTELGTWPAPSRRSSPTPTYATGWPRPAERAKEFSWARTAKATIATYELALAR